jgi:enamine deaminase RidA (YjgF/YER057c/UK114 family)
MAVTLLNPDGLPKPPAGVYSQVAIATGTRHVYIAGQIARDADGNRVATGDLAGQVEQAYRNIATALASAGATFSDVVRLTFYVVDWKPEKFPALLEGIARVTKELGVVPAPASLIEVVSLYEPDVLVEIEATAVVD